MAVLVRWNCHSSRIYIGLIGGFYRYQQFMRLPTNSIQCTDGRSSGTLNNVAPSTSGFVLTSNGASAQPTFQANPVNAFQVNNQVFTASGTYTPTSGMVYCQIICLGAGGGGGGCAAASGSQTSLSGAGGAGEYAVGIFCSATIGASKSVTIGAAGAAGSSGNNAGGTGGTTSVGSTLISAVGGSGGKGGVNGAASNSIGGAGGTGGTGGDYRTPGAPGSSGFGTDTVGPQVVAIGASSQLGSGGFATEELLWLD